MKVTAKADYAVRAVLELATAEGELMTADRVAEAQRIPRHFLDNILTDLRRAGIVATHRGPDGGSRLARPAEDIALADVMRADRGPARRGARPPARVVVVRRRGGAPARRVDRGARRAQRGARAGDGGRPGVGAAAPFGRAPDRRPGGVEGALTGVDSAEKTGRRHQRGRGHHGIPRRAHHAARARRGRVRAGSRGHSVTPAGASVARSRSPRRSCSRTPTIPRPSGSTAASTTPTTGPTGSRCRTPPRRWRCSSS